jgi:hypothetical protein
MVMERSADLSDVEIVTEESSGSALSWSAIIGGAVAAAGVTLILTALGAGLGFASLSPWSRVGASATTFAVTTAIWFVVVQWLSSAFGGYLAGRLRAKWVGIHTDESVFRDTAHGILAWALATVVAALLLSSAVASAIGGTARTAAQIGAGAAQGTGEDAAAQVPELGMGYLTDSLFRTDHPATPPTPQDLRAESGRILLTALGENGVSDADKAYLTQLVAANTGVDQTTAAKRVDDAIAQVKKTEAELKQKADAARKAATAAAFATAFSMLIGAFIAGAAGALGGRHRDEQPVPLARATL